jgi:SAM-dependent methyltransferase
MTTQNNEAIRNAVRERYKRAAEDGGEAQACSDSGCCGSLAEREIACQSGYSEKELAAAPDGAFLGLSCGNPQAIADLKPGETVLDLGAGGGFDCFLAAQKVGPKGLVIGVDMTPEMVSRARQNARRSGLDNVSFRLGEIEALPVADASVDVIISNCVINLVPDKRPVYEEAFRVLRPGGRLAISDVVARHSLTDRLRGDLRLWSECAAGACLVADLIETLGDIGFERIEITINEDSAQMIEKWSPGSGLGELIASASIQAIKPGAAAKPSCC